MQAKITIDTLVMFFCFLKWRHLFTCPILAAGIFVNKVALRDSLHQEGFHGNRLGQRSHYFLLLLRKNSFVALWEQRRSANYVKAWLYLEIFDGWHIFFFEIKWKSRVSMSFMILDGWLYFAMVVYHPGFGLFLLVVVSLISARKHLINLQQHKELQQQNEKSRKDGKN